MRAADVMTPDPVCISPDASITDAIQLMLERKFSGLPVVDARGALVGIVTEGDLVRRTETGTQRKRSGWLEFLVGPGRLATEYLQARSRKVEDVMTPDVRTVTENTTLDEIVHLMERHQINRVLVMRDGKLVGIVTRARVPAPRSLSILTSPSCWSTIFRTMERPRPVPASFVVKNGSNTCART